MNENQYCVPGVKAETGDIFKDLEDAEVMIPIITLFNLSVWQEPDGAWGVAVDFYSLRQVLLSLITVASMVPLLE
jgi:hypothetical protein